MDISALPSRCMGFEKTCASVGSRAGLAGIDKQVLPVRNALPIETSQHRVQHAKRQVINRNCDTADIEEKCGFIKLYLVVSWVDP
ncbi:hypothetical protein D9M71_681800 [compost metagenome]